jgi:5-methylcytosine-specific restriction endonuclease McrA
MAPPTKESILRNMRRLHKRYNRECIRRNVYWGIGLEPFHKLTSAPCAYCGKPPSQVSRTYTYNGIDRKNPKKGYTDDNCVTACKECNWIKGDRLTFEEMRVVGEALRSFRAKKKTGE